MDFCPVAHDLARYEAEEDAAYRRELAIERMAYAIDAADIIDEMTDIEREEFEINVRILLYGTSVSAEYAPGALRGLFHTVAKRMAAERIESESQEWNGD